MDTQKIILHETARQDIYRNLADCYHLPERTIPIKLKILAEQLSKLNSKAVSYVNLMQADTNQIDDLDQLKIDFTRLFIGPYSLPAPPYGSIYLEKERKIMGDSTMDVKARYENFGLGLSKRFKDVPDHIASELEFMFFLIYNEIGAIRADEPEQTCDFLSEQKSFLSDHLNMWISDFADGVIKHAGTDFYRHLVQATRQFITEDLETLTQINIPATHH